MATGKHLFSNPPVQKGLSGRMKVVSVQNMDISENFHIAYDTLPETMGKIKGGIEQGIGVITGLASVGLLKLTSVTATSTALAGASAGTIASLTILGTVVGIAGVVVGVLAILGGFDVFDSCSKAAVDPDDAQEMYKIMAEEYQKQAGLLAIQKPTSYGQDNRIAILLQTTLRMLSYYECCMVHRADYNWSSSCSKTNTRELKRFIERVKQNFINKINSLSEIYEIEYHNVSIDFADPKLGFQALYRISLFHNKGRWNVPFVTLRRKPEAENAMISFHDFAYADRNRASDFLSVWDDPIKRQKLIEVGTQINREANTYGYTPEVTLQNGNLNVQKHPLDYDNATREQIVRKQLEVYPQGTLNLTKCLFKNYRLSRREEFLVHLIENIEKERYSDVVLLDLMIKTIGSEYVLYRWFYDGYLFMAYLKENRTSLYDYLYEKIIHSKGFKDTRKTIASLTASFGDYPTFKSQRQMIRQRSLGNTILAQCYGGCLSLCGCNNQCKNYAPVGLLAQ